MPLPGVGSGSSGPTDLRAEPKTEGLPVILVTALSATEDKVRGLDAGANDFVTKPYERAELMARVRACLRKLPSQAEPS
jgi:DNA-binding response OmpR family regulator